MKIRALFLLHFNKATPTYTYLDFICKSCCVFMYVFDLVLTQSSKNPANKVEKRRSPFILKQDL